MTPGVLTDAAEKSLEKQMGCMAGFFQLFDRHQILNGKRVYSAKRLPSSSPGATSPSPSERSDASPTSVCSSVKEVIPTGPPPPTKVPQNQDDAPEPTTPARPSATPCKPSPAPSPATGRQQTLPLPVFSAANSATTAWKLREAPRLSLDSRIFDGKPTRIFPREIRTTTAAPTDVDVQDRQKRSPSVVARLMGLDNLMAAPSGALGSEPAPHTDVVATDGFGAARTPQLRRSSSESRASRDLLPPTYAFQADHISSRAGGDEQRRPHLQPHISNHNDPQPPYFDPITAKFVTNKSTTASQKPPLPPSSSPSMNTNTAATTTSSRQSHAQPFPVLHRKSFFDAQDIFPEPAKLARSGGGGGALGGSTATTTSNSSMYGEIEKRLRMRGIDEPAKDLETLKQILEALQLKGLLHQTRRQRSNVDCAGRNLIYDCPNPPLILMKPVVGGGDSVLRSSPSPSPRRRDPGTPPSSRLGASPRKNSGGVADPKPRRDRVAVANRGGNAAERRGRSNLLRSPSDLTAADVRSPRSPATVRRQMNSSSSDSRRSSPAQSPRSTNGTGVSSLRRPSPEATGRSPRTRKPPEADFAPSKDARLSDESSTVSESSYSAISQFDFEKVKIEEYREGRNLLERCDKLLNSIAELTDLGAGSSSRSMEIQQPSPVSVLDASAAFYCDDTTTSATVSTAGSPPSPSPAVSKRCLDFFKAANAAEERPLQREQCWSPMELHPEDEAEAGDGDFLYVAEVLCASAGPSGIADDEVFCFLEKRLRQGAVAADHCDKSTRVHRRLVFDKSTRVHRRLVFDTVVEIVDKRNQLSTWEAFTRSHQPLTAAAAAAAASSPGRAVWEELKQIRECGDSAAADDFFEAVCGVLKKDMAMDSKEARGWGNRSVEMSDAVLDIERLIFKDLVAETIRDLAAVPVASSSSSSVSSSSSSTLSSGYNCRSSSSAAMAAPRRKLVF